MTRNLLRILLPLTVAFAAWLLWHMEQQRNKPGAKIADAPPVVLADVLACEDWQSGFQATGQLRAAQGAELSAPVSGIVAEIRFQAGDEVRAGSVLLRLRAYDDDAKLKQLRALVRLWEANLARDKKQFEVQAVSRATLDQDAATLTQYQAQVEAQQQLIEQKLIRAPFDGRIGIRQVDLGQYLSPGTAIASIEALDQLYLDFNVVQRDFSAVHPGQTIQVTVDAWPERLFQANVLAVDSSVDPQSRMVLVRATLDNHDRALLPGMFAVARLDVGSLRPVVAVPQAAVSFSPYGDFIYVLTPKPGEPGRFIASSQVLQLGEQQGDKVVVTSGLKVGDRIVTAGGFKLRTGATVVIGDHDGFPEVSNPELAGR
jgi:membrane fusion protein (multidrug efflux system)